MSGDNVAKSAPTESRDVRREGDSSRAPQIDASQFQSGDNLRSRGVGDNTGTQAFNNPAIEGATASDRSFNTAAALSADKAQAPRVGETQVAQQAGNTEQSLLKKGPGADIATTQTTEFSDGRTVSDIKDGDHNTRTSVERRSDGTISTISKNAGASNEVKTSYDANGKPTSQDYANNGSVEYDSEGKVTKDTRKDKSDEARPLPLETTQNPNGTTTYKAGNTDGTYDSYTFRGDGTVAASAQKDTHGVTKENTYYNNGNLEHLRATSTSAGGTYQVDMGFDRNGVQRTFDSRDGNTRCHGEYGADGRLEKSTVETEHGKFKQTTVFSPDGAVTTDTKQGERLTHQVVNPDGSTHTTDHVPSTKYTRDETFTPGKGTTIVDRQPGQFRTRQLDAEGQLTRDDTVTAESLKQRKK